MHSDLSAQENAIMEMFPTDIERTQILAGLLRMNVDLIEFVVNACEFYKCPMEILKISETILSLTNAMLMYEQRDEFSYNQTRFMLTQFGNKSKPIHPKKHWEALKQLAKISRWETENS